MSCVCVCACETVVICTCRFSISEKRFSVSALLGFPGGESTLTPGISRNLLGACARKTSCLGAGLFPSNVPAVYEGSLRFQKA